MVLPDFAVVIGEALDVHNVLPLVMNPNGVSLVLADGR